MTLETEQQIERPPEIEPAAPPAFMREGKVMTGTAQFSSMVIGPSRITFWLRFHDARISQQRLELLAPQSSTVIVVNRQ